MNDLKTAHELQARGQFKASESIYREALKVNPQNGEAYWGLGNIAMSVSYYEAAVEMYHKAVRFLPKSPILFLNLANAYNELRRFDKAGQFYKKAAEVSPKHAPALYLYGNYQSSMGKNKQAEHLYRMTLELDPYFYHAYLALVRQKNFKTINDPDIGVLKKELAKSELSINDQMTLYYSLGKAFYDLNESALAMQHLTKANELQRSLINFSVTDSIPFYQSIKEVFTEKQLQVYSDTQNHKVTPIFIVGQARSGSTLLEAMLGSHTAIYATGELPYIGREIAAKVEKMTGQQFPQACQLLTREQLGELGNYYIEMATAQMPQGSYFIDKQLSNFQSIGFIKSILPDAIIINIRRHPMDVGFSIFRNYFELNEPNFCSLNEISQYYLIYEDLMSYWHSLMPEAILDVHYESLVKEPELILTEVLSFCGLDWQSRCIDFHTNTQHVQTLSKVDIKQPVHQKSISSWIPYQDYLSDLSNTLANSINNYETAIYK
ncbi:MAG: tetratricopeptide (TPR) repeat protein [Enterobacterales bacterium]|jgi:tetratricopeptide (TPR) repeat protein